MVTLIDGRRAAKTVRQEAAERATRLLSLGVSPGLAIVQVGQHAPSDIYVGKKVEACAKAGIRADVQHYPANITDAFLLARIRELNADPNVHGILVQLPLPDTLSTKVILDAIDPDKDVDGLHPLNIGRLHAGRPGLVPCTPLGVMRLLADHHVDLKGKHAVVVGRSAIVGRPMSWLLLRAHATVTTCHRHTPDTQAHAARADVLVVAVGRPGLVTADWVKPGAVVVDVGINRIPGGRVVGDVAFDEVAERASAITPVPGGVGPMTVAMLLQNVLDAATFSLDRR